MQIGSGYIGSPILEKSESNQEVIPSPPATWTIKYSFYKFSFSNDQECHVSINGGDPIYLRPGQGFLHLYLSIVVLSTCLHNSKQRSFCMLRFGGFVTCVVISCFTKSTSSLTWTRGRIVSLD